MKTRLLTLALSAGLFASASAQTTVVVTNYNSDAGVLSTMFDHAGSAFAAGVGTYYIGTFSISDAQITEAWDVGNLDFLMENFTPIAGGQALGGYAFDGVYQRSFQGDTPSSGLGDKPVYSWFTTTTATDLGSEQLIFKHDLAFPIVEGPPPATINAFLNPGAGTLLVGEFGNYSSDLLGSPQFGYNTVEAVPEPSTLALLGLGALAGLAVYRRRR